MIFLQIPTNGHRQLDLFFQVVIGGGSDLAGTLRPEKKRTVVWPAMFFSAFKLQPEKLRLNKKVQSSRLTGRFFRRVQITTRKHYDWKKKVQSPGRWRQLRFGGNMTTGKKMYSCLAGCVFQQVQITTRKNYDQKKRYSHLANLFFRSYFFPVVI